MNISNDLLKGNVATLVLSVLSEQELYGYQIVQLIGARSGGVFNLKEGTLYPLLHLLEQQGYLMSYRQSSKSGRERRYYKITDNGLNYYNMKRKEWNAFSYAVNTVLDGGKNE